MSIYTKIPASELVPALSGKTGIGPSAVPQAAHTNVPKVGNVATGSAAQSWVG